MPGHHEQDGCLAVGLAQVDMITQPVTMGNGNVLNVNVSEPTANLVGMPIANEFPPRHPRLLSTI